MNDEEIKIIENIINRCTECKFATCENCEISWNEIKVIKKLLIKYKLYRKQVNDAFDRGWIHKDKILREIEELKLMKVEGEAFTTAVKFAIKILQDILERSQNENR